MTPDMIAKDPVLAQTQMARALQLAERGLFTTDPNPRVGCVLWRDGQVVGEGWHARAGEPHAEVLALRTAADQARGATAYVTLEPCSHTGRTPPCADALIAAGVAHVHCATADPNPRVAGKGLERLRDAGVGVSVGALQAPARALNAGFFSRFERARPFVRLKLAMSLDARTAHAHGVKAWISGPEARADVQRWRARSAAILTGAGTVRSDDPRLDVRLAYGPWVRQPLRVVLDPDLRCDPAAKVFQGEGALVYAAADSPSATGARSTPGAPLAPGASSTPGLSGRRIERVARGPGGLDLDAVLRRLAEHEINELLVECGPRLAGAFLRAGLVDELVLYVAPTLLGSGALPLADFDGHLGAFEFRDVRRIGADLRLILAPKKV